MKPAPFDYLAPTIGGGSHRHPCPLRQGRTPARRRSEPGADAGAAPGAAERVDRPQPNSRALRTSAWRQRHALHRRHDAPGGGAALRGRRGACSSIGAGAGARSAIRRPARAEPLAAAWRMPIRRPSCRRRSWPSMARWCCEAPGASERSSQQLLQRPVRDCLGRGRVVDRNSHPRGGTRRAGVQGDRAAQGRFRHRLGRRRRSSSTTAPCRAARVVLGAVGLSVPLRCKDGSSA